MRVPALEQFVYIFCVYLQMVILYFWIHMFFGKVHKNNKWLEWIMYFSYLLISYFLINSIEQYIGFHIVVIFLLSLFYQEKRFLRMEKLFLILICLSIPELIAGNMGMEEFNSVWTYGIYTNLWQAVFAKMLQAAAIITVGMGYGFLNRKNGKEEVENILLTASFLIVPLLSFYILGILRNKTGKDVFYHIVICLTFMNLLIFCAIKVSFSLKESKEKQKAIEKQNLFYQNQLDIVRDSAERMDMLRHDLKNHLLALNVLIKNGAQQNAIEYIEKMTGQQEETGLFENTGNLVIDSILNYKKGIALRKGISFETQIEIPDHFGFADFDMAILLGNLLDNALTAAEGTEPAYLSIFMKYSKSRLLIFIRNSVCDKQGKDGILEEKQYGVGLQSVKQTVLRYHGSLEVGYVGGEFYGKLLLFLESYD